MIKFAYCSQACWLSARKYIVCSPEWHSSNITLESTPEKACKNHDVLKMDILSDKEYNSLTKSTTTLVLMLSFQENLWELVSQCQIIPFCCRNRWQWWWWCSNHRQQHNNIQFFTGRMPFLFPTNSVKALKAWTSHQTKQTYLMALNAG